MKKLAVAVMALMLAVVSAACGTKEMTGGSGGKPITIAWLPNESGGDLKAARDEIGKIVEEALGRKVEHKTTTDYIIAVEAIANGNADLAFLGAQAYVEANKKNKAVLPLVVPTGKSGTLDDAVYYGWLAVKKGNEGAYKSGDSYSMDNIPGKKFSWVSNSSTSGFKVPSAAIVAHFSKQEKYKNLKVEDLLEGGKDKFFSEVMYGSSHQGAAINMLTGKAEVASFCDACVDNYIELVSGTVNKTGAVYKVRANAAEPFNKHPGEQFVLIHTIPVLNAPFVVNTKKMNDKDVKKLQEVLASDAVANNTKVFVTKESGNVGMFAKTGKERFSVVEDKWFQPIRDLNK